VQASVTDVIKWFVLNVWSNASLQYVRPACGLVASPSTAFSKPTRNMLRLYMLRHVTCIRASSRTLQKDTVFT